MITLKIIIQYDGTRYNGWQRQKETDNTIQGKIETTLSRILNQMIDIDGSGRTDAGVHALGQVASFSVEEKHIDIKSEELPSFIKAEANHYLPQDIRIISCEKASDRFHARLNATGKIYEYRIDNGEVAKVFDRKYLTRIDEPIDIAKLRKASEYFIGTHDFLAFCSNKHFKKSSVRTIHSIDITENDGIIYIRFYGTGFLKNMVRILVGTMIDCALDKFDMHAIPAVFESKNRANAAPTAPPEGLFLMEVKYD